MPKRFLKLLALAMLLAIIMWMIVEAAVDWQKSPLPESGSPLKLVLTPVGNPSRDQIRLRIDVTNNGAQPIGWDSEFSAFLTWRLRINDRINVAPWYEADKVQLWTEVDQETASKRHLRERFIRLDSGKSMSKDVDLLRGCRQFGHTWVLPAASPNAPEGSIGPCLPVLVAHEPVMRFTIPQFAPPERTKSSQVWLEYNTEDVRRKAFTQFFGLDAAEAGFWDGITLSNRVELDWLE